MPAPRFSNFKPRRDRMSSGPVIGADRAGVHGDLTAMLDPRSKRAADISVERSAVLIRTLRYAGTSEGAASAETLGAKSHALYEFLMAHARRELVERTEFLVPVSAAKAFLQVKRTDKIREYMADLTNTWVSHDFTDKVGVEQGRRHVRLLQCSEDASASGERFIRYSLDADIRKVILAARAYTWLELAPFAKFSCKYAARLYPILALRAGMSFAKPHPISVTPEELAARLGWAYEPGKFKFSNFEARCLLPALADISLHVSRFQVLAYERKEADTRGRPVVQVLLTVSKATKPLAERQRAEVSREQAKILKALMVRRGVDVDRELPAIDALARAATVLNTDVIETAKRWADALDRARISPWFSVGRKGLTDGDELMATLADRGVGCAFELWMRDPDEPALISGRLSIEDLPPIDPDFVELADETTSSADRLEACIDAMLASADG